MSRIIVSSIVLCLVLLGTSSVVTSQEEKGHGAGPATSSVGTTVNSPVADSVPAQPAEQAEPPGQPREGATRSDPPPAPGAERGFSPPPLQMIAPGVFEIGGVRIMKQERQVLFPGMVNMDKGLLEYVIVGDGGKLHESLLRTSVEPYCLQLALLLVGLEGTTQPLEAQGDQAMPDGDPVSLWIEWKDGSQTRRVRVEDWITNKKEARTMAHMNWVFTGSIVQDGHFRAQVEKSIAAIFHDPVALIDNPLPEGGSDEIWFVNEGGLPPAGTPVTVIIQQEEPNG